MDEVASCDCVLHGELMEKTCDDAGGRRAS